jgi:hypothetical protein
MPLQEEVLLMTLVIGLHLYDSMMLLYCNEGVLVPAGKGWTVRFGFREPKIRGKELFVPAPWLLHRPMFRLTWQFDGNSPQSETADWQALRVVPLPMIALVWIIAIALFLLLPLGFFTLLGHGMLLAAVVVIYPGIVLLLLYMWLHRDRMSLTKKQVGKFAFEFLTCPPFALNVVRTISSSRTFGEDLVTAARRLQDPEAWAATREQLTLRLDEEIELEDEGSERMARLQAHRLKLAD